MSESIRSHLREFDFRSLFVGDLGWDHNRASHQLVHDDRIFLVTGVAQKRGMQVFACVVRDWPSANIRKALGRQPWKPWS